MSNYKDLPYLKHILDAINNIENSVKSLSKEEFKKSEDVKDSNVRRIEVIGEAVKNVSKETKNRYPEIEWRKIAGTRDIMICQKSEISEHAQKSKGFLTHAYFNVDLDITQDIIKKDLPDLKKKIKIILERESLRDKAKTK